MRRIILGAAAPLLFGLSSMAPAAPPAWRVSEATGEVKLVENGRARAATRGALLSSGALIATGANARAVIVRGEEFVVISPRTQLRVPAETARSGITQLIEDFGTAMFKIRKKVTPHFGVQTPYLAAVVKGTTFTVTVGADGGSVQVTEGAVEVSTLDGGAAELVRPGTIAQVGASDLFQLTIQGENSRVIRSEGAPAGTVTSSVSAPAAASTPSRSASAPPLLVAAVLPLEGYAGPPPEAAIVAEPVPGDAESLSEVTDGLLHGQARADMVLAELGNQARDAAKGGEPGNGSGTPGTGAGGNNGGGSPPSDPGNDNGNGNPPADPGNGNGNPPADPGNGNGNGPPADPGNGNGNGPPADPGNGNGNGPPADPGNGNGNGPPADPGNGNGNGPPADPGNGNGNPPPPGTGNGGGADPTDPGPPTDVGSGNDRSGGDDDSSGSGGGPGSGNGGSGGGSGSNGGSGGDDDSSGSGSGGGDDDDSSGSGSGSDDDDNSGPGSGDDDDDNSGPGSGDDDDDEDTKLCVLGICVVGGQPSR